MFFQELQITQDELRKLLATDNAGFYAYMQSFITRKFYVGDTGINRKTLKDWETSGLLPYPYKEEGWRKFSFCEWVWLECINEFRKLGISIEKINTVKTQLFEVDVDELFSLFQKSIQSFEENIDQKEKILSAYTHPDLTNEIKLQAIEELQMSPFLLFIVAAVVTGQNLCIVYNNSNYCSIFVMGATDNNIREDNQDAFENLINDSFIVVNLRKIINSLFQKTDLRQNDNFVVDFLSVKERKILDHIRSSNAKEIVIKFDESNEPTRITVNRNQISGDTLNKIARYLKKGNYQTVQFTTRNGELINYEEEDSIKL